MNPLDNIKITHEDVLKQLVQQNSVLSTDIAVLRAENLKLKEYITETAPSNAKAVESPKEK